MTISRDEVRKVAGLARLALDDVALDQLSRDMSKILEYVKILEELDTSAIDGGAELGAPHLLFREDVVRPGVEKSEALAAAPRSDERGFLVPAFVDEGGKSE
jgi:aspartyl-tRNA(Asn)/glutamyl-tRNA(Gln) amidotransferase subunit C